MHSPHLSKSFNNYPSDNAEDELSLEARNGVVSKRVSKNPSAGSSKSPKGSEGAMTKLQSKKAGRKKLKQAEVYLKAIGVLGLVTMMIAACMAGFISEEQRKQEEFRSSVADLGAVYAGDIQRQVRSSVSSVRALEAMIKVDGLNFTTNNFHSIAQTLIETYGGISNLQLAPYGTVSHIHPLVAPGVDNRPALGHALMVDPSRRDGAVSTIHRGATTIVGPVRLLQGGIAVIARHPVFSKFADEFLPTESWTGNGKVYRMDCSTPAARAANCSFPGPMESNSTPTYFWGFTTMLTVVTDLLAPIHLERLGEGKHRIGGISNFVYQLSAATPHPSMSDVNGIFGFSPATPPSTTLPDPIEVDVMIPELDMHFVLRLAPADGWPTTSSDFWVQVALLCPLTVLVALALGFILLGNLRKTWVRAKELEHIRLKRQQNTVLTAVSDLDHMYFPMCLIEVEEFERLGCLQPHEKVRDEGKLQFFDSASIMKDIRDKDGVVFVSHQWVGFDKPDPEGVQYLAMVDAVKKLRHQGIRIRWIWADYLCIPQQNKSQQQNAIDSLTVYVSHSSVFVTVAPSCQHANLNLTMDMMTYQSRGWCRLEQISYLAATISQDAPAAFASTEEGLKPLWGQGQGDYEERALAVIEGEFTCCTRNHPGGCRCDKTKIVGVMLGIYWRLLAWHRDLPSASARLTSTLGRLEASIERFLPGFVAYTTEDGDVKEVEVFGDLIPVMRELFNADSSMQEAEPEPIEDTLQESHAMKIIGHCAL